MAVGQQMGEARIVLEGPAEGVGEAREILLRADAPVSTGPTIRDRDR